MTFYRYAPSSVMGAGAYPICIWVKYIPEWVSSSLQVPMAACGGSVPSSRVPQQCSLGVLAPPPFTWIISVFCPHGGLSQEPFASHPSPLQTEILKNLKTKKFICRSKHLLCSLLNFCLVHDIIHFVLQ